MPTYEYVCKNCGKQLEVVQSIHDDALTTCPECGGTLRKLFGNVGVVFKGSGFYKTDSRNNKKSASSTSPSAASSSETKSSESKAADSSSSGTSTSSGTSSSSSSSTNSTPASS